MAPMYAIDLSSYGQDVFDIFCDLQFYSFFPPKHELEHKDAKKIKTQIQQGRKNTDKLVKLESMQCILYRLKMRIFILTFIFMKT